MFKMRINCLLIILLTSNFCKAQLYTKNQVDSLVKNVYNIASISPTALYIVNGILYEGSSVDSVLISSGNCRVIDIQYLTCAEMLEKFHHCNSDLIIITQLYKENSRVKTDNLKKAKKAFEKAKNLAVYIDGNPSTVAAAKRLLSKSSKVFYTGYLETPSKIAKVIYHHTGPLLLVWTQKRACA